MTALHEGVAAAARDHPEAVAVELGAERLTYGALERRAGDLAGLLLERGAHLDAVVGVCLSRLPDLVVALLAVLKAGAAYLPLDPADPTERIRHMLLDADAVLLVAGPAELGRVPGVAPVLPLDAGMAPAARRPLPRVAGDNLAAVLFTSGSTGAPKGVGLTHRGLLARFRRQAYLDLRPSDRVAQVGNPAFDVLSFELWGTLLAGATAVGVDEPMKLSPAELAAEVDRLGMTVLHLTSAWFSAFVRQRELRCPSMRYLLFGGEAVEPGAVAAFFGHGAPVRLVHMYGPTEITSFAAAVAVNRPPPPGERLPLGGPLPDTELYVLDRTMELVPIGVPGELYIGGAGLARGYLGHGALTAERFVPHPLSSRPGERLYRSGDVVRWRPDGALEFLGRVDDQVKLRGFRIEPREIEVRLAEHPAVREAAVMVRDDGGDRRLVAYLVPAAVVPSAAELRAHLLATLPGYLVPSAFVPLEAMPLTPRGKLDWDALPPEPAAGGDGRQQGRPPATPHELEVARLFSSLLGAGGVSADDGFFDLGGHSLLAARLVAEIAESCGVELPLRALFDQPTVAGLAAALDAAVAAADLPPCLVPVRQAGELPPFFCVHPDSGEVSGYRPLAERCDPRRPFYGLRAVGFDGTEEPLASVEEMATMYLAEVRELQPHGPYLLGGCRVGALVALEMACQLRRDGELAAAFLVDPSFELCGRRPTATGPAAGDTLLRRANLLAASAYRPPERWPGPVAMVLPVSVPAAGDDPPRVPAGSGLTVWRLPGDAHDLLREPLVSELGRLLSAQLDRWTLERAGG